MEKIAEMDKIQRQDHDTLIRLEGKVDSLILNVSTLQSGLDTRIKELEQQVEENSRWISDFSLKYKVTLGIASAVGAMVTFVLTTLSQLQKII